MNDPKPIMIMTERGRVVAVEFSQSDERFAAEEMCSFIRKLGTAVDEGKADRSMEFVAMDKMDSVHINRQTSVARVTTRRIAARWYSIQWGSGVGR